jgi:hypothetical protein
MSASGPTRKSDPRCKTNPCSPRFYGVVKPIRFRGLPYGGGQAVTGIELIHLLMRSVACVSTT